jgi:8-oxo-dGTP pyrophosphatase MutT (NUDIX family)
VNGVLGAVYKELGEPGKDEVSKKKKDVPYAELPVQHLGGAVVFGRHQGDVYLALVHDIFGHWTLSKGKIGDKPEFANETVEEGTIREIKEEMGLDIKLIQKVGENEYVASDPKTGKKRKHVTYFLAEAPYGEISLKQTGGLDDARWFRMQDALELNFYDDMLPLITKALQAIQDTPIKK